MVRVLIHEELECAVLNTTFGAQDAKGLSEVLAGQPKTDLLVALEELAKLPRQVGIGPKIDDHDDALRVEFRLSLGAGPAPQRASQGKPDLP
jgi:hypothetical protein